MSLPTKQHLTAIRKLCTTTIWTIPNVSVLASKQHTDSPRMQCIRSAVLLQRLYGGIVQGGEGMGGFKTKDDVTGWSQHCWLVIHNHVVDITADQFSEGSQITILPVDEAYRGRTRLYKHNYTKYELRNLTGWVYEYKIEPYFDQFVDLLK